MTPSKFVELLAAITPPNVFNPYSQLCPDYDGKDAAIKRSANLIKFLEASLDKNVDTIWIARDLGYRGGRRTGIPLTDEIHLPVMESVFGDMNLKKATLGPAMAERTAAMVWQVIKEINTPVFLWNIFPLHPHEPSDPHSNRCHTKQERELFQPLLNMLISMLRPKKIVAIGRDSQLALTKLNIPKLECVRHPSYGGQKDFVEGLYKIYGHTKNKGHHIAPCKTLLASGCLPLDLHHQPRHA